MAENSTRWAARIVASVDAGGQGRGGLGVKDALIEIKNLESESGETRGYNFAGLGVQAKLGHGGIGTGGWSEFETTEPVSFDDFVGDARLAGVELHAKVGYSSYTLSVDGVRAKYDNILDELHFNGGILIEGPELAGLGGGLSCMAGTLIPLGNGDGGAQGSGDQEGSAVPHGDTQGGYSEPPGPSGQQHGGYGDPDGDTHGGYTEPANDEPGDRGRDDEPDDRGQEHGGDTASRGGHAADDDNQGAGDVPQCGNEYDGFGYTGGAEDAGISTDGGAEGGPDLDEPGSSQAGGSDDEPGSGASDPRYGADRDEPGGEPGGGGAGVSAGIGPGGVGISGGVDDGVASE